MNSLRHIFTIVQAVTFLPLGLIFLHQGNWRLGLCQLMLGVITVLVYL